MLDLEQIDAAAKETRQDRRAQFKAQAMTRKRDNLERRQARRPPRAMQEDSIADTEPA